MWKPSLFMLLFLLVGCGNKESKPVVKEPAEKPAPVATESAKPEAVPDVVLATVNGEKIGEKDFNQRLGRYVKPGIRIPQDRLNKVKKTILERMVDDILILQAAKNAGVELLQTELDAEFEEHRKRFKSPRQFDLHLQQSGMSEYLVQYEIRVRVTLKKLLKQQKLIDVGEAQAREFYDKNLNLYTDQDQVHAAHILVKLERNADEATQAAASDRVKKVQEALKAGRDFKELATEMSDGPSKTRGGDLGFFRKGQMVRAFEEVAFALDPGAVSEPVRTQFGWHIIKVFGRKEGEAKTFDEVKEGLIESLTRKKVITEKRRLIKELRVAAKIEMNVQF